MVSCVLLLLFTFETTTRQGKSVLTLSYCHCSLMYCSYWSLSTRLRKSYTPTWAKTVELKSTARVMSQLLPLLCMHRAACHCHVVNVCHDIHSLHFYSDQRWLFTRPGLTTHWIFQSDIDHRSLFIFKNVLFSRIRNYLCHLFFHSAMSKLNAQCYTQTNYPVVFGFICVEEKSKYDSLLSCCCIYYSCVFSVKTYLK